MVVGSFLTVCIFWMIVGSSLTFCIFLEHKIMLGVKKWTETSNRKKYGPEKTLYLGTFRAVLVGHSIFCWLFYTGKIIAKNSKIWSDNSNAIFLSLFYFWSGSLKFWLKEPSSGNQFFQLFDFPNFGIVFKKLFFKNK